MSDDTQNLAPTIDGGAVDFYAADPNWSEVAPHGRCQIHGIPIVVVECCGRYNQLLLCPECEREAYRNQEFGQSVRDELLIQYGERVVITSNFLPGKFNRLTVTRRSDDV